MQKFSRSQRLAAITAELVESPNQSYPLGHFCDKYDAAKSSISEDLGLINQALVVGIGGAINTNLGAAGGVSYQPGMGAGHAKKMLEQLAQELNAQQRRLAGGFLYYSDLLYNPVVTSRLGKLFAQIFAPCKPHQILTLETKGIPLALFTAWYLNCPLLIARRNNRVTEGPALSTNYLTGSGRRIETMFLPKRCLVPGSNILIIDDFMKAGGSARGLEQLVLEFDARVVGTGVLIATQEPEDKLVSSYTSLLTIGADSRVDVIWGEEND